MSGGSIRYRVVSLLDAPDELRSVEIGQLDQGDEVQLLEKSGAYWRVLCPDGRQGWLHKMTLGDVVTDETSSADAWNVGDIDGDVLSAYLGGPRPRLTAGDFVRDTASWPSGGPLELRSMPAGFTSAKFVGRESAFARLAPALEAAIGGVPTTVLIEGTGGIGASRFLTEAMTRLSALAEPFTVLRGRAVPAGTDEPYGADPPGDPAHAPRRDRRRARRAARPRRSRTACGSSPSSTPGWPGPGRCPSA